MGKGQQPSLAQRAEDRSDELLEAWQRAAADAVVTDLEISIIGPIVLDVCDLSRLTNLSQATGLALIRLGPEARRSRDLLQDLDGIEAGPEYLQAG